MCFNSGCSVAQATDWWLVGGRHELAGPSGRSISRASVGALISGVSPERKDASQKRASSPASCWAKVVRRILPTVVEGMSVPKMTTLGHMCGSSRSAHQARSSSSVRFPSRSRKQRSPPPASGSRREWLQHSAPTDGLLRLHRSAAGQCSGLRARCFRAGALRGRTRCCRRTRVPTSRGHRCETTRLQTLPRWPCHCSRNRS